MLYCIKFMSIINYPINMKSKNVIGSEILQIFHVTRNSSSSKKLEKRQIFGEINLKLNKCKT